MKVVIIVHSVCGNTYLMGKFFFAAFQAEKIEARFLRVEDPNLKTYAGMFDSAKEFYKDIMALPVATPQDMAAADLIVMGSPTYFGNVSAAMKTFMDSTAGLWVEAKFVGKKLFAFSSAGHAQGGGDLCLQAINIYGQHMGMSLVSIPSNIKPGTSLPAYGLLQYSGPKSNDRPDADALAIKEIVHFLIRAEGR